MRLPWMMHLVSKQRGHIVAIGQYIYGELRISSKPSSRPADSWTMWTVRSVYLGKRRAMPITIDQPVKLSKMTSDRANLFLCASLAGKTENLHEKRWGLNEELGCQGFRRGFRASTRLTATRICEHSERSGQAAGRDHLAARFQPRAGSRSEAHRSSQTELGKNIGVSDTGCRERPERCGTRRTETED